MSSISQSGSPHGKEPYDEVQASHPSPNVPPSLRSTDRAKPVRVKGNRIFHVRHHFLMYYSGRFREIMTEESKRNFAGGGRYEPSDDEIFIPNVSASTFSSFLEWLYHGKSDLGAMIAQLTGDQKAIVWHASRIYVMPLARLWVFGHQAKVPALRSHVIRVMRRYFALDGLKPDMESLVELWKYAKDNTSKDSALYNLSTEMACKFADSLYISATKDTFPRPLLVAIAIHLLK